jgi:hypothetical protein
MHRVGGPARDGASAFPRVTYAEVTPRTAGELDFQHYHTYDETVSLLKTWAKPVRPAEESTPTC